VERNSCSCWLFPVTTRASRSSLQDPGQPLRIGASARRRENTSSTYVYHLDDDTSMGVDTVASIAEFIAGNRNGEHLLAQGVLAFPMSSARPAQQHG